VLYRVSSDGSALAIDAVNLEDIAPQVAQRLTRLHSRHQTVLVQSPTESDSGSSHREDPHQKERQQSIQLGSARE
jgi:hypothetical protein